MIPTSRSCGWAILAIGLLVATPTLAQDDQSDVDDVQTLQAQVQQQDDQPPQNEDDDENGDDDDAVDDQESQPADNDDPESDPADNDDPDVEPAAEPQLDQPQLPDDEPPAGPDEPVEQPDDEDWPDQQDDDEQWPDEFDDDDFFEEFEEDVDFEPGVLIDDDLLDRITPVDTFPHVDWGGQLRVRPRLRYNFDLDTQGTSAVLPPVDTVLPADQPADPDADALWTTDLRFRLAPTLHLTESLRVHTDLEFLQNAALGADPRHNYFVDGVPSADRRLMHQAVGQPSPVNVREAYGELHTFFGTISAGRMLDHWGLGITANDGNCADCDWGDQVDRLAWQFPFWMLNVRATYDLPDTGPAPRPAGFEHGYPHQLGQLDTAHQYTLSLFHSPASREDVEQQLHRLAQGDPIYNGGLYYRHRWQTGDFPYPDDQFDTGVGDQQEPPAGREDFDPIYRGLNLYSFSPWVQMLWEPQPDQHIRLELEGLLTLGGIDNTTNDPVGFTNDGDSPDVNCFDADARDDNSQACRTNAAGEDTDKFVSQYGLALESEFNFGGPVSFGLNTGFASGGEGAENAGNWGWDAEPADQLDFTRFSPDYHVDLILFREVIGTVTNAYYANPYAMMKFFDSGMRHMEFQIDGIASRAFNAGGTPGASPWLGLELDASLRYVDTDNFSAALDGGLLFPLGGLAAREGRQRLNYYGTPGAFTEDLDPGLAWTIQARLNWDF